MQLTITALYGVLSFAACAPGRVERVEYIDQHGEPQRAEFTPGATAEEVLNRLGPPTAVRHGPKGIHDWIYVFQKARWDYVFHFRNGKLRYVNYLVHRGESP